MWKKAAEKSLKSVRLQEVSLCDQFSLERISHQSLLPPGDEIAQLYTDEYITHTHRKQTPVVQRAGTPFDLQRSNPQLQNLKYLWTSNSNTHARAHKK